MGQEDEEKAEMIATIQHDHIQMKAWYNSNPDAKILHPKYGSAYPDFWRDVVTWDGWKTARKLYLKSIEGKQQSSNSKSSDAIPRKRKSRWGDSVATGTDSNTNGDTHEPKRKSRWGDASTQTRGRDTAPVTGTNSVLDILPGLPSKLSSAQSAELAELQKTLRECNMKLENLEQEAARVDKLPIGHRDRSPSPPPVYGPDGKRKNTRAVRWREKYTIMRQDTLEKILKLSNGNAAVAVAPSLFNRKRSKKVHIPLEQHPNYNFIGLIIGPRGKTQKEMESKTGCKIAIRGKGSVKEGARGRRDGKPLEGEDEPLHVLITGESQESVDAAAKLIEDMLVVIDDDKNIHKQQQLRELALLNGTLLEDEYCPLCAEKGHRAFECPTRFSTKSSTIKIKCLYCGETSHASRDCKQKDGVKNEQNDQKDLDSDYLAFMNELDGKPADAAEAVAPPTRSLVTTIVNGKPVVENPPLCQTIKPTDKKEDVPVPISKPASTGPLITTISSRVVKAAKVTSDDSAPSTSTNLATGVSLPFPSAPLPAPIPAVPSISSIPPVPTAPSAPAPGMTYPPPGFGYGQPPPPQQYSAYGQPNQYYVTYPGQQQPPQQAHQQGWDYRNFYNNTNQQGGQHGGAGGFNWWDAAE
jgi:splicing factor 1